MLVVEPDRVRSTDIYCTFALQGCDGSILIDSTANQTAEKDDPTNKTVEGYNLVDAIKSALEMVCPGTVSCADIVALAAKTAVFHVHFAPQCRRRQKFNSCCEITLLSKHSDVCPLREEHWVHITDILSTVVTFAIGHLFSMRLFHSPQGLSCCVSRLEVRMCKFLRGGWTGACQMPQLSDSTFLIRTSTWTNYLNSSTARVLAWMMLSR